MKKGTKTCIGVLVSAIAIVILLWTFWLTVPTPSGYEQGAGVTYATELAIRTQRLSFVMLVLGWISVTLGGVLAAAGAVLGSGPLQGNDHNFVAVLAAQRGIICAVLAVVFGGLGWQCIDRSTSATKTASIATAAIATATTGEGGDRDMRAYKACVKAKSAWLEGRMNNDRLQSIVDDLTQSTNKTQPTNKTPSTNEKKTAQNAEPVEEGK